MGSPAGQAHAREGETVLVERARGGDARAFQGLVEAYQDRVYALALRIVRSPEEAEEVAQDAFVRAWRALPRFRGEARFSTWLYRIAVRRAFDGAAGLRVRRQREAGLDDDVACTRAAEAPGADAPRRRLEHLVAELPAVQRAAITLYYYEDRAVAEVARILDLPDGTVKTHLHRARAALRRAWEARGAR